METPELNTQLFTHIHSMNEHYAHYERYFNAMLVKSNQHAAFFADLKAFREQDSIIKLLHRPDREAYKECTNQFLASRFAHPWARISPMKNGWFIANWGSNTAVPKEYEREVRALHGKLLPIWCQMRRRMFTITPVDESKDPRVNSHIPPIQQLPMFSSAEEELMDSRLGTSTGCPLADNEDGSHSGRNSPPAPSKADASAAASLFVGVAAATVAMKSRRGRKFLAILAKKPPS